MEPTLILAFLKIQRASHRTKSHEIDEFYQNNSCAPLERLAGLFECSRATTRWLRTKK